MKKTAAIALATLTLLLAYSQPGHAHGHFRGSIWIGPGYGPGYGSWWWAPPPTPVIVERYPVIVQEEPVTYIHQEPQPQQQPQQQFWYYCADKNGYYPYVKECPKGWTKVAPTPPPEDTQE